jgi:hypothetical protein
MHAPTALLDLGTLPVTANIDQYVVGLR